MKGKKHSKRLAAFMLALVLIATTVINPGSITSVFAETAEEAKTASEKKTEAENKEEPTTKAKEERQVSIWREEVSIKVFKLSEFFFLSCFSPAFRSLLFRHRQPRKKRKLILPPFQEKSSSLMRGTIRTVLQFFKSLFPCGLQRRHKK